VVSKTLKETELSSSINEMRMQWIFTPTYIQCMWVNQLTARIPGTMIMHLHLNPAYNCILINRWCFKDFK